MMTAVRSLFRVCVSSTSSGSARFSTCGFVCADIQSSHNREETDTHDHIRKQLLLAGLHYLKTDVKELKENVVNRAVQVDVDKLVRVHLYYLVAASLF